MAQIEDSDPEDGQQTRPFQQKAMLVVTAILLCTGVSAAMLLLAAPSLVAAGMLAYSFGLRHAVDADHIAAIDNVTRRLTVRGRRPTTVGLFFALGHSTVVFLVCLVLAMAGDSVRGALKTFAKIGGIAGAMISGTFLVIIGGMNLYSAMQLRKAWKEGLAVGGHEHAAVGCCTQLCPRLFDSIRHPAQMLIVGFLFGLGFDTSSEVSLLAMVAMSGGDGSRWSILLLPAMFAAGMSLVDTLNGILMAWAYGQALQDSMQRLYYNLFLTGLSAVVALGVGAFELMGVAKSGLDLHGWLWDFVGAVNDNFEMLGCCVIVLFIAAFVGAMLYFGRLFPGGKPLPDPAKVGLLEYLKTDKFIDRSGID
eukprot:TRINITY_DN82071_c0_g1_i1.p1 TRINITY_DN82071_c0_g1~~TRINITY_DN82071_c0_g1_i1.p1  ORF type:complete len:365 (+),score=70.09 TRINITY_DN82071_c0_g1_i1:77-1171(+)